MAAVAAVYIAAVAVLRQWGSGGSVAAVATVAAVLRQVVVRFAQELLYSGRREMRMRVSAQYYIRPRAKLVILF